MIHYHGTPIGGTVAGAAEFLLGRHALVSHARQDQMAVVAECCQSFVLDNGAFSQWKRGKRMDVDGYLSWVSEWVFHPGFDWALIPDDIEGDEQDNDALLDIWNAQGSPGKGVPIWHMHESLDRLGRLVETFATVALGSSGQWPHPGARRWWDRMSEAMEVACDSKGRPRAKLHGLRMMNPRIFEHLPLSSADSTNAGMNQGSKSRFGQYIPPTSGLRATVIAARIERLNSSPIWEGFPRCESICRE